MGPTCESHVANWDMSSWGRRQGMASISGPAPWRRRSQSAEWSYRDPSHRQGSRCAAGTIDSTLDKTFSQTVSPLYGNLWRPWIPPHHLTVTSASGIEDRCGFRYSQHTIFAQVQEDVKSLVRVTSFSDFLPTELIGLQFHFNDRVSAPAETPWQGHVNDFYIDGPGGEIICAVVVFWSAENRSFGISVRSSLLSLSSILDGSS